MRKLVVTAPAALRQLASRATDATADIRSSSHTAPWQTWRGYPCSLAQRMPYQYPHMIVQKASLCPYVPSGSSTVTVFVSREPTKLGV